MNMKRLWMAFAAVMIVSFSVLGYFGMELYRQAPPIPDRIVVTGGEHAGDFLKLLKNGKDLGINHLEYAYQEGEGGIADALALAEEFVDGDDVCVILGDNIIERNISLAAQHFSAQGGGAKVLLKEVPDPERFGVVRFEDAGADRRVVDILEKPVDPPSNHAVIGIYFYDSRVFDICREQAPSARGELEITDVNRVYLDRGTLTHDFLDGWWIDAGTHDALLEASRLVARTGANNRAILEPATVHTDA